jgi:hypothetical protein
MLNPTIVRTRLFRVIRLSLAGATRRRGSLLLQAKRDWPTRHAISSSYRGGGPTPEPALSDNVSYAKDLLVPDADQSVERVVAQPFA